MNTKYWILLMTLFFGGCSTLTKTQINAVNCFAQTSQDFSQYPSRIVTGLAEIRSKRGVLCANSIREKEQDMVAILENDSKGLEELKEKIKQASAKFEGLAATLGKACKAVEVLIKIITTAVGAELL